MEEVKNLFELAYKVIIPFRVIDFFLKQNDGKNYFNEIKYSNERMEALALSFPRIDSYNTSTDHFYCFESNFNRIKTSVEDGKAYDENLKIINDETLKEYICEYGNGFCEGYRNFNNDVSDSKLFRLKDEDIALKIFNRVYNKDHYGSGNIYSPLKYNEETEGFSLEQIKFFYSVVEYPEYIFDKRIIREMGYGGGEFYKAWVIIFQNPNIFEPLFIKYTKQREKELLDEIELNDLSEATAIEKNRSTKDYKKYIWFKTGVKLATGEAYDLYEKYKSDKGHYTKICLELGFKKTDRTYFSTTIADTSKQSDKNTFANKDKVQKLHSYLIENNLPIGTEFLKKYREFEFE